MKMFKLVVNNPRGFQEIIQVSSSGSYFDKSRVVWDERIDGPLPKNRESQVGGLYKRSGKLTYSQVKFDSNQAKVDAIQAEIDKQKNNLEKLKSKIKNRTATVKELCEAIERFL